jgi:hypothetical protein
LALPVIAVVRKKEYGRTIAKPEALTTEEYKDWSAGLHLSGTS